MGNTVLDEIRQDLRERMNIEHTVEAAPLGAPTAASLFDQADWFAEHLTTRTTELIEYINERGFTKLFAGFERVRRCLEAASAIAYNAAAARDIHLADGHRSPQAFLQASVNLSNRERLERQHLAAVVAFYPQAGLLLADGTLPVAHALSLAQLVVNDRIPRNELAAVMSAFVMTANLTPHDAYAKRVRSWGRRHDTDGSPPDPDVTHRRRNVRLSNVLDMFVLEGRFGAAQGAKLHAILTVFENIEFDRDWQAAKAIHGDNTNVSLLARTPQQRRADALEAIFLAATGDGIAKDVEVIINIVTDAHTFTHAAHQAAHATTDDNDPTADTNPIHDETADEPTVDDATAADTDPVHTETDSGSATVDGQPVGGDSDTNDTDPSADGADSREPDNAASAADNDGDDEDGDDEDGDDEDETDAVGLVMPSPAEVTAQRRFCHTIDGVDIDPLHALQAVLDGYFRAVIVGDDGVIINLGRKQRFFRGNARLAARLQAGLDQLHRCSSPGCRARARHIDHATEWASPQRGRTDLANVNPDCGHHNLWKTKHGYTVRRDDYGNLRTYRPDGTELHPY